jgi:flagellar hook-associated protein 1 FlgK
MTVTTVLNTASSGLLAAQIGIRTVADNIANANTPGYVRKAVEQTSLVTRGVGSGVHVEGVARVVDQYLQSASLRSGSAAGQANVLSEMLDRVQSLLPSASRRP